MYCAALVHESIFLKQIAHVVNRKGRFFVLAQSDYSRFYAQLTEVQCYAGEDNGLNRSVGDLLLFLDLLL